MFSSVVGHGATHHRRTSDDAKLRGIWSGRMSWARTYILRAGDVKSGKLKSRDAAVQVILVGAFDFRGDDFADAQRTPA
jgi:hypothetical protein